RTQHNGFFASFRIRTTQYTDGVPGNSCREDSALHKTLLAGCGCVAARLEPELSKLRTNVFGCETFVSGATASSLHRIARQKPEFRANVTFERFGVTRCLLRQ